MPKLEPHNKVEDGQVMGYVSTDMVGSKCTFGILPVEEWIELSEEEAEKAARDALYESGVMEWVERR